MRSERSSLLPKSLYAGSRDHSSRPITHLPVGYTPSQPSQLPLHAIHLPPFLTTTGIPTYHIQIHVSYLLSIMRLLSHSHPSHPPAYRSTGLRNRASEEASHVISSPLDTRHNYLLTTRNGSAAQAGLLCGRVGHQQCENLSLRIVRHDLDQRVEPAFPHAELGLISR